MQQRISLITLGVKNLQRSRDFYVQKFGWKPIESDSEGVVFFQLNGFQLGLFPQEALADDAGVPSGSTGFSKFSLAYNVDSEQEVNELVAELEEKGVRVLKQPSKVFWGGYSSYIADPDDNLWEIAFNPFMTQDEVETTAGKL